MQGQIVDKKHVDKKHIVIEGPIGVGKSSLCHKMVAAYGGQLFLEKPADNPFLEKFYKSPKQHALATQLFFLLQRAEQMQELNISRAHWSSPIVADFMIEKDPLFAKLILKDDELALYQQIYQSLNLLGTQPDLVVYLQAPLKVLKARIKKRNIVYEQKIDDDYLNRLCDSYTHFFHHYSEAPLLIVNAADFNPIDNNQHFTALMTQVEKIQAGKHFFNPLAV